MIWNVLQAAGGLGLFLLGMMIMTEGLRAFAGPSLGALLRRFTRSPVSGAATGTLVTALVQSSSATTVSAVGFAGAGLLTFPQALGIVFGANLGTTITGWMVALFGFKLELGTTMPLLVLAGALLRLTGRPRVRDAGMVLAGFGLVFIGIDAMRAGMGGFEGLVTPDTFPSDDFSGRIRLLGIGLLITLVTQSSSAGVAAALVALDSGAIELRQAAAMVVGMDVGTTVTAGLATLGGSVPARRTGWAHVVFNLLTGVGALLLLPLFFLGLETAWPGLAADDPQLALVGFHSCFNALGVILVLPVARPFARLVERLVPDRPLPITKRLDAALLVQPELALRATLPTLEELAGLAVAELRRMLGPAADARDDRLDLLTLGLDEVHRYVGRVPVRPAGGRVEGLRSASLHVIDQLGRLLDRERQHERADTVRSSADLTARACRLDAILAAGLEDPAPLETLHRELESGRQAFRDAALRGHDAEEALDQTDAYRWLERVTYHAWRVAHHLAGLRGDVPARLASEPPEPD